MPVTELRFVCPTCDQQAEIDRVYIQPDTTLKITGHCNVCEFAFARDYQLFDVFVRQEEMV